MIFARRSLTMTIIITAFERSPDGGKGLARDTHVRHAEPKPKMHLVLRRLSAARVGWG
jgi:glutathione S-transferase